MRSAFQDVRDESPRVGSASYRRLTRLPGSAALQTYCAALAAAAEAAFFIGFLAFFTVAFFLAAGLAAVVLAAGAAAGAEA